MNKKKILKITDIQYNSLLESVKRNNKKKLVINENQYLFLEKTILETQNYDRIFKQMVEDLDLNYEPASGMKQISNEFYTESLISKKVNGETITPKLLLDYLKHKYVGVNEEFIKQLLTDWYKGNLKKGGRLTKNVNP